MTREPSPVSLIQWIGIHGVMKLSRRLKGKINQYSFRLDMRLVIGVMSAIVDRQKVR